jgi:cell wall-associated NlpC family hydrolase
MAVGGVSLAGVGMIAAGSVLAYSGVNDPVGGPVGVLRDILSGKTPSPQLKPAVGPTGQPVGLNASAGGGSGSRVLAVAQTYLGVPYRWGGASRSGIDCSGLVMVSYRDGAGIKLPHKASLQAARGVKIDRSQIQAGDLVAWGVPGLYPHIALAVDASTVITAPTWGKTVEYQSLWQKKVPGYGYPDIYRIIGAPQRTVNT